MESILAVFMSVGWKAFLAVFMSVGWKAFLAVFKCCLMQN